jgi:hypothetical protein
MPKPTSKSRQELRSRFVHNAIPNEKDFADLIAASLNQADDGVLKLPDQPLGLVRQKPDQPVLRFYADPAAEGSAWQLQLGSGDKPGFGLAAADGKLALFVDGATGNVGIGTAAAGSRLTIQGDLNATTDPESRLKYGGMLGIKSFAPQIDFIDTDRGNQWAIHVNESRMYFVREPWENDDLVLDGKGNIGMGCIDPQGKLNIRERIGTPASALKGTLLLDHEDAAGGASSIVFRSRVNRGSDYAFIEFRDKNPLINDYEAALLTIGVRDDNNGHIALMPSGNVGVGTTTPSAKLQITGNVCITSTEGIDNACKANHMAPGSLTIGGVDRNYGGGTNWNSNTAGLLLETLENTEIAIHDMGNRLASFMYYEGANNRFTIGRDMGRGAISTVNVQGGLQVNGQTNILTGSNPIRFSSAWSGFPDDKTNGAEICNDTDNYKTLMLVGNKSNGGKRRVSVWDDLEVNGNLKVKGKVDSQNKRIQVTAANTINLGTDTWTDMPQMIVTANIDGPVLVLFKAGGVQAQRAQADAEKNVRAYFRLLIDGNDKATATQEFHNDGWELRDVSLVWLESSLAVGNHEFKVQWRRGEHGRVTACWYGDLRSLIVVNL